jgi:hypothetical protein
MHYLIVDGMLSGTGLRDAVEGGYVDPAALGLSDALRLRLTRWLQVYEDAHFRQYAGGISDLDAEGAEITRLVRRELPGSKVEYFSSARMTKLDV